MPTKSKPHFNVNRLGYSPSQPLYDSKQTAQLASDLRCSVAELERPLAQAMLAIGPFLDEWRSPPATEPEQREVLLDLANRIECIWGRIQGMDKRSLHKLLMEYGADGDSEGDASEATKRLQQDVSAVDRLQQNLRVAGNRLSTSAGKRGQPKTDFERFAAEKLLTLCVSVHGERVNERRSIERRASRHFLCAGLRMLGMEHATASGAANAVLNQKKYPVEVGNKFAK